MPRSRESNARQKFAIIGILLLETVVIFGVGRALFSLAISGAIVETFPVFCLAVWIGFVLSGSKEFKARLSTGSHAALFLGLYLVSFLPLIYTQDTQMFENIQQQSIGKSIVFIFIGASATMTYHLAARFTRSRHDP